MSEQLFAQTLNRFIRRPNRIGHKSEIDQPARIFAQRLNVSEEMVRRESLMRPPVCHMLWAASPSKFASANFSNVALRAN